MSILEPNVETPVNNVSPEWPLCEACLGSGKYIRGRFTGLCFRCKGQGRIQPKASASVAMPSDKLTLALNKARDSRKPPIVREPKLRFKEFEAKLAKPNSANPGAIYFKAYEADTAGETYLGKLINGMFHPTARCTDELKVAIHAAMIDPLPAAIEYANATHRCSCCGIKLTVAESIARKMGPICAERFGF